MRVRFLQSIAGSSWSYDAGFETDLEGEDLRNWLAAGIIEPVIVPPESAELPPPEKSTPPRAGRKRGTP